MDIFQRQVAAPVSRRPVGAVIPMPGGKDSVRLHLETPCAKDAWWGSEGGKAVFGTAIVRVIRRPRLVSQTTLRRPGLALSWAAIIVSCLLVWATMIRLIF